jgi:Na+-transporting methylmalonyl-CoA/oxaloacetate decarboxylase gamma subunit
MDNLGIGLIITILGMSITFLTLFILTLVIRLLSRIFPYKEDQENKSDS